MSTIVGIDPSLTSCGIAVLRDGFEVTLIESLLSVGHSGDDSASYAERSDRIVSQARLVLSKIPRAAELVVIEGPAYGQSLPSTFDRSGLWWGLYSALLARGARIAVCPPTTRSMYATGQGRAKKAQVLDAVREMWPEARPKLARQKDNDRADALVLASMGAQQLGWMLPYETKPRHAERLAAVAWPKEIAA